MGKATTSGLHQRNDGTGSSSQKPELLVPSTSEALKQAQGANNNSKRSLKSSRRVSQVLAGKKYSLRSSHDGVRVLRSASNAKNEAPDEPVNTPIQPAAKGRQKDRSTRGSPKNEFSKIQRRVRYILNRMNYEQSLIEAYASEGWKGQSLEKIRPEKELERAKAEILRCKLRIREAFQSIDSLLSEGKLEESLFDSAGEISSEDIFCAKCGSSDVTLNNDIVLCDGICDRGFHQKCLNPPLLTEDIPPGDEGWLCPACCCKIYCIDVLNELQGSGLRIQDSWEKVFPEAAALANGAKQTDESDLPSDDSEDNDYDPSITEPHGEAQDEGPNSEDDEDEELNSEHADFITSSKDSDKSSKHKKAGDDLGLPSEDSEDDDYDPAGPDSDKDVQKEQSSSDESDFTSDSDDFCTEIAKSSGQDEVSTPSSLGFKPADRIDDLAKITIDAEAGLCEDMVEPVSGRRRIERLDYKKLYDEAYGKEASSDSNEDEDWFGMSTPEKGNNEDSETDSAESLLSAENSSRRTRVKRKNDEHIPWSAQQGMQVPMSNGSTSSARKKHFGPIIGQKLHETFKTDPYPSRATKETLAQEVGLTFLQVDKWFASTRHYTKVAATKRVKHSENRIGEKNNSSSGVGIQIRETEEMENLTGGRNDIASEETMAENMTGGSKLDSPVSQGINFEHTVDTNTPVSYQCDTTLREVGTPKGEPRQATPSRKVGRPKGGSTENQIPGLEHVDEARKKAILRELRKRKMSR